MLSPFLKLSLICYKPPKVELIVIVVPVEIPIYVPKNPNCTLVLGPPKYTEISAYNRIVLPVGGNAIYFPTFSILEHYLNFVN